MVTFWVLQHTRAYYTPLAGVKVCCCLVHCPHSDTGGGMQVDIVAHSAGGWLARSFVGDTHWRCTRDQRRKRVKLMPDSYFECADSPHPLVKTLVTLGSPHAPPVKGKHVDMTGGALQWVNINWPRARYGLPETTCPSPCSSILEEVTLDGFARFPLHLCR